MSMTENTVIRHYNKLEGIDRLLTEMYGVALRAVKQDVNDPYSQHLLKAILAVIAAQRQLGWTPFEEKENEVQRAL